MRYATKIHPTTKMERLNPLTLNGTKMTSRKMFGFIFVLFAVLLSLLLCFLLIYWTSSEEIKEVALTNITSWNIIPNKLKKTCHINVKIEDKIYQGELFPEKYVGFFEARKICRSKNMSLPHQGFDIEEANEIQADEFWIDAFVTSNFSIVCPWKGSDTNIIKEMLEEMLEINQKRMLGKY
jgi:hypothetical protein